MRVEFTPEAQQDLFDIARFIADDNPRRAASFIDEMDTAIRNLGEMPDRHPTVWETGAGPIRRMPFRAYVTFYRIETGKVVILRILHGARVTNDFLDDLG